MIARAQVETCGPSYYAWSPPWSPPPGSGELAGLASAAASDASDTLCYAKGNPITYLAKGGRLYAIRRYADEGQPGGSIKWRWPSPIYPPPPNLQLITGPRPIRSRGQEVIFAGGDDGFLYKFSADQAAPVLTRDTRRRLNGTLVCTGIPADQVVASPAAQLYELSSSAFQAAADAAGHCNDDLVFVVTKNGCSDHTENRVFAYWASDLSVAWTFNDDYARSVDACAGGFEIDYATNTLYFGTDHTGAIGQNSLFALDTITGTLKWATNAGAILNRPILKGGKLYVGSKPGSVQAYDPAGNGSGQGVPLWPSPLLVASTGTLITLNMTPFLGGLLVIDSGGILHAVHDTLGSGTIAWEHEAEAGVQFKTAPVVLQTAGHEYAYVGRDDGTVQQIELGPTGAQASGVMAVDGPSAGVVVYEPAIDVEPGPPAVHYLVVAASTTKVTRIVLPICNIAPY